MLEKKNEQDSKDIGDIGQQKKDKKHKPLSKKGLTHKIEEKKELMKKLENELLETKKIAQEKENLSKEYLEHLKRLQADFENYKKRQENKRQEYMEYANELLLHKLLPVLDNLERALNSTKNDNNIEAINQGINNIIKEFYNVLHKEGIKPIKAIGHKFDPYRHEAVMSIETDEYPEDTVIDEFQKGYYLKSKVLRPAMVKVAVSVKEKKSKI